MDPGFRPDNSGLFPLARNLRTGAGSPRVYLAGAIEAAPDGGVGWRRDLAPFLQDELGHTVHDPTDHDWKVLSEEERRSFRRWKTSPADWPRFQETVRRIIRRDAELILADTDYLIAYWDEAVVGGGGTHGELTLAYLHAIPVFLVLGMPRERVSSWILGCSEAVFDSFDSLRTHLKTLEMDGRLGLVLPPWMGEEPPEIPNDARKAP